MSEDNSRLEIRMRPDGPVVAVATNGDLPPDVFGHAQGPKITNAVPRTVPNPKGNSTMYYTAYRWLCIDLYFIQFTILLMFET